MTDHLRKVYSAGGIMPDTVVVNASSSGLVQKLLADGMFFRFATNFFSNNQNRDFKKYSSDMLLNEFTNYLHSQNFDFVSRAERLIDQLKTAVTEENLDQKFLEELDRTKNQIDANHSNEIEKYKNDILFLIREELAARIDGRQGRIKESLKMDNQFAAAVNILSNKKLYYKFVKADAK